LNPLAKSATIIEELVLTNALKKTEDGDMFLLYDNGQEVEDRILAYATTQNLEKLNTATTWLCGSTFATCPTVRDPVLGSQPLFPGVTWARVFVGNAYHKRGASLKG
ncbi:hypothetical protein DSO57_1022109, partial [Entomophthora muscae]